MPKIPEPREFESRLDRANRSLAIQNRNGKGDSPRNCFSEAFRREYDRIFRRSSSSSKN